MDKKSLVILWSVSLRFRWSYLQILLESNSLYLIFWGFHHNDILPVSFVVRWVTRLNFDRFYQQIHRISQIRMSLVLMKCTLVNVDGRWQHEPEISQSQRYHCQRYHSAATVQKRCKSIASAMDISSASTCSYASLLLTYWYLFSLIRNQSELP